MWQISWATQDVVSLSNVNTIREEIIAVCLKQDTGKAVHAYSFTNQKYPAGNFTVY